MGSGRPYPPGVLERLQETERELLVVIDKVCREHDITYFIIAGTLLGAVRHGGFIPWDDDIDIGMPWEDYCRFREIAPTALPEGYSYHDANNTDNFFTLWIKIYKDGTRFMDEDAVEAGCQQGIFLDILPFHNLEADEAAAWKQCKHGIFWQRFAYLHFLAHPQIPKNTSLRPLKVFLCEVVHYTVARLFSPQTLERKWVDAYEKPRGPRGEYWMNASYIYGELLHTSWLLPAKDIAFDDLVVRGPQDPHAVLHSDYGDTYMQFPPEDKRYIHLPLVLDFGDGVNVMEGWV